MAFPWEGGEEDKPEHGCTRGQQLGNRGEGAAQEGWMLWLSLGGAGEKAQRVCKGWVFITFEKSPLRVHTPGTANNHVGAS